MSFTIPNEFIAGTKAKAQEVNENFSAIADGIDQIYADISTETATINSSINNVDEKIDSVDEKIKNFLDTFSKGTTFCVNEGKTNSIGEPDILSNNEYIISFDVSELNPLYATTCEGNYFKLTEIEDITLPTLSNGTYTIYINSEGNTFYHLTLPSLVSVFPDLPSLNQICILDNSEPLLAYEYDGNDWIVTDKVPVGSFISTDGTISDIKTFPYNQNGYNINIKSFSEDFSSLGWCKLPNGFILQWGYYSFSANQCINFPVTFPNSCLSITAGDNYDNLGASAHVNIKPLSKSQFQIASGMYTAGAGSGSAHIIAIGY